MITWMDPRPTGRARRSRAADEPDQSEPLLTKATFQAAVEAHSHTVYRYVVAHVGPNHAEDVAAETFAAAWRSRHKFVDPSGNGLEAWLIGIARNVVASHWRLEQRWLRMCADAVRQRADASTESDESDALARAHAAELARTARIAELIATMPERDRDPLLLHVLHGRSYRDIALILGIPQGTVQSRISRACDRLAKSIDIGRGGRP